MQLHPILNQFSFVKALETEMKFRRLDGQYDSNIPQIVESGHKLNSFQEICCLILQIFIQLRSITVEKCLK